MSCLHSYNKQSEAATTASMGAAIYNRRMIIKALILFTLGVIVTFVINLLQMEYKANLFPNNLVVFIRDYWWCMPLAGLSAVYIGVMYPYMDHKLGECHYDDREWTTTIRSFAFFFGLNHFCAKLHFASTFHFFLLLMVFCMLFWYWFDHTKSGLLFNITHALFVIISTTIFRQLGIIGLSEISYIHFYYLQTCLLWFVFSGCITFGNIGRLMNLQQHKEHQSSMHHHID